MTAPPAVVQFYDRVWNAGDPGAAAQLLTDDFTFRSSAGVRCAGRARFLDYVAQVRADLEEYRCEIITAVTERDACFARVRCSSGPAGSPHGAGLPGRRVQWDVAALSTMRQERIRDVWVLGDLAGRDQQPHAPRVRILQRRFTADEAARVARWAYEPPFDVYDSTSADVFLDSAYLPVVVGEDVVGFVCFGAEARVAGQVPEPDTVDVGAGLRPDLVGRGLGTRLMPVLVEHARRTSAPRRLRAAVAAFNKRSQRLCESAGFRRVRTFEGPAGRPFVELVLEL